MKKSAPYLLSLFLLLCANVVLAINPIEPNSKKELAEKAKETVRHSHTITIVDFLQPFYSREKSLPKR